MTFVFVLSSCSRLNTHFSVLLQSWCPRAFLLATLEILLTLFPCCTSYFLDCMSPVASKTHGKKISWKLEYLKMSLYFTFTLDYESQYKILYWRSFLLQVLKDFLCFLLDSNVDIQWCHLSFSFLLLFFVPEGFIPITRMCPVSSFGFRN